MTSQVDTKVRFVRCPKCLQVLVELPEVPLYQCGGCATVLRAKSRRSETSSIESSSLETDSISKTRKDDVSETSSSNKDFATRPEAESLSDKENVTGHDVNGNCVEFSEGRSVLFSYPEIACPQIKDSSIEAKEISKCVSSVKTSKRYICDDNDESGRGTNFSDELPSSGELALEAELYNTKQHNKNQMWQKGDGTTFHNSPEQEYPVSVLSPGGENDNCVSPENNDDKSVSRENESTEKNTITGVCDSKLASRSPSKESLVSFYLMSSDNEQNPDRSLTEDNFGSISLDTLGSSFPPMANNYPKTQSYYAYDGSESSYDGNGDRISERISQPSLRKTNVRPTEMLQKNNVSRANSGSELAPTSFSSHTDRNHHLGPGKSTETNRYATGNRTRLTRPGPESYRHSSLPLHPVFKPPYPEPDNIDLLRTVCELKDQLNRMHFQYDRFSPEMEVYSDVHERFRTGYNLSHNINNQSRLAFSGESARFAPRVSCSRLHCHTQDWHNPSQLPPHPAHCKNGPYGALADLCSQQYSRSEALLCGCKTKPDKKNYSNEITTRARLKQKYFAGKRHVRPVAGGAPVAVCYHCSELLHLPTDFLLFKKKYHQLMCDACKMVLRFSVQKGTHIVPYVPRASATLPPSEVSQKNTEPVSHAGSIRRVDRPVSCTDDYYNGNMSSGSSFETVEDRKMKSVLIESRDECLMRGDESAGSSLTWRKVNTEIEEASPLHQLMGYSSPSQVLD